MVDGGDMLADAADDRCSLPVGNYRNGAGIIEHVQQFLTLVYDVGRDRDCTNPPESKITDEVFR